MIFITFLNSTHYLFKYRKYGSTTCPPPKKKKKNSSPEMFTFKKLCMGIDSGNSFVIYTLINIFTSQNFDLHLSILNI